MRSDELNKDGGPKRALHSFSFSPSGKLVQIEYALAAVASGAPSVGIKASNGIVLATEKKHKSILYEEQSMHKVEMISDHIGMVYSGKTIVLLLPSPTHTHHK